ncbi:MAG TPA: type III polyketide synthase [Longimicrobiales bacterium]|nr:type III polyketide synthase [Longimicrobiales bacterium]
MSLRIEGIGVAAPEHAMPQDEAAELLVSLLHEGGRARTVRALYARSGIRKRHSVLLDLPEGESTPRQSFYAPARDGDDDGPSTAVRMQAFEASAPPLAAAASDAALRDAGMTPGEITHLVTVSCTGIFAPGLDAALVERLGMPRTVQRTHVGFMGCHGALNGLRVASSLAGADPDARVLLCCVELCSLHLGYRQDADTLVANALFADGAAAVVGVGANGSGWRVAASGTLLMPDSADAMSWRIGDHGFRMTLSARVPELIRAEVGGWLRGWLKDQGLVLEDVRTWAVHPGGPRVLTAFGEGAGLEQHAFAVSREVLAEHGNMSSATLLFILQRLREAGAEAPVVAVAFGPGLVAEVALLV